MWGIHFARHHAGNGKGLAMKIDCAPDDRGIAVKGTIPKAIADYRQGRCSRFIFVLTKSSTDLRRQSDYVKKVRSDKGDCYSFRFPAPNPAKVAGLEACEREVLE